MRSRLFHRCLLLLLTLLLSATTMVEAARALPIPLDEYRSRIAGSVDLLRSEKGSLGEAQAGELRHRFPPQLDVVNRGGEPLRVDNTLLHRWIQEAETSPRGREHLLAHLTALSEQLSLEGKESHLSGHPWERSRAALEEVYRSGEFRHLKETDPPAWKLFILDLLRRLLGWVRDHVGTLEVGTMEWIAYTIYGLVILAGVVLMVWMVRSSDRPGWRWRRPGVKASRPGPEKPLRTDWHTLRTEAEKKAEEGSLREAVRAFFVSVLLEGQSKGWWVYQPEATNMEHLARVGGPEERRDALRKLTDLYERAWYGVREPGRQDFLQCREWLHCMEAAP